MKRSDDPRLLRALISHRVLVLSNTLALAASRYYPQRFQVRLPEWRVIDALHAGGSISANQISHWLRTDKAWVKRSVDHLIVTGHVRRRPDPRDGRRLLLRLTPKGQRAYAAIAGAARRRNENLLAGLARRDRESLERLLGTLQARAVALLDDPDRGFVRRLRGSSAAPRSRSRSPRRSSSR